MPTLGKYAVVVASFLAAMSAAAPSPSGSSKLQVRQGYEGSDGGDGNGGDNDGDTYPDPHPDPSADPHPDPSADPHPDPYTDPHPDPYTDPHPDPYTDPHPDPHADPKPHEEPSYPPYPGTCGTCNPISGLNGCDITTSCINTGGNFHCACRAGYKSSGHDAFRLTMPNYEFLVFVPEHTTCDTLCNNPNGFGPDLCKEVPLQPADVCPP